MQKLRTIRLHSIIHHHFHEPADNATPKRREDRAYRIHIAHRIYVPLLLRRIRVRPISDEGDTLVPL